MIAPIMIDLTSVVLSQQERDLIVHPLVGGVILFSRNYVSKQQLSELTNEIRETKKGPILIAVDQEGGRVQRFKEEFAKVEPMANIGKLYDYDPTIARMVAVASGYVLASEISSVGIDFSFAPVLDIYNEASTVIGNRAFHQEPQVVYELANAFISGLAQAGLKAVAKHFPGHGSVIADTHKQLVTDERSFIDIDRHDLIPFKYLIADNRLTGVMTSHISFPQVDNHSVSFSAYWLQTILRDHLGFDGVIFSDDLNMSGASSAGEHINRVHLALGAGCDMVLLCNCQSLLTEILADIDLELVSHDSQLPSMQAAAYPAWQSLANQAQWSEAISLLTEHKMII